MRNLLRLVLCFAPTKQGPCRDEDASDSYTISARAKYLSRAIASEGDKEREKLPYWASEREHVSGRSASRMATPVLQPVSALPIHADAGCRQVNQASVTRANLRLPTCTTNTPAPTLRPLSLITVPSIRTPPCSTMRKASEVDAHRLACLSN